MVSVSNRLSRREFLKVGMAGPAAISAAMAAEPKNGKAPNTVNHFSSFSDLLQENLSTRELSQRLEARFEHLDSLLPPMAISENQAASFNSTQLPDGGFLKREDCITSSNRSSTCFTFSDQAGREIFAIAANRYNQGKPFAETQYTLYDKSSGSHQQIASKKKILGPNLASESLTINAKAGSLQGYGDTKKALSQSQGLAELNYESLSNENAKPLELHRKATAALERLNDILDRSPVTDPGYSSTEPFQIQEDGFDLAISKGKKLNGDDEPETVYTVNISSDSEPFSKVEIFQDDTGSRTAVVYHPTVAKSVQVHSNKQSDILDIRGLIKTTDTSAVDFSEDAIGAKDYFSSREELLAQGSGREGLSQALTARAAYYDFLIEATKPELFEKMQRTSPQIINDEIEVPGEGKLEITGRTNLYNSSTLYRHKTAAGTVKSSFTVIKSPDIRNRRNTVTNYKLSDNINASPAIELEEIHNSSGKFLGSWFYIDGKAAENARNEQKLRNALKPLAKG